MEVGPTTHYMMGGVRVDAETQAATVPGLFAAGEVAGGLHGSNRLGGNSLSDLLVFGRRAGLGAAAYAKAQPGEPRVEAAEVGRIAAELVGPFERVQGENPHTVQEALQDMMGTYVGIARTEEDLRTALEAITRAALERRESRGAHTRVEYPDSDKHFGTVNVIVRRQNSAMTVTQEPLPELPAELRRIVEGEV